MAKSRLFTFGCSFTHFFWPTWADILGSTYDEHQNWAGSGYGNRAIVERLSECVTHNKITADDTIIIQFTDFHRHDMHQKGIEPNGISNWRFGGNIWIKPYELPWIKEVWSEESYVYHTCNFINLGISLLKSLPCKYHLVSMIDFKPDVERLFPEYLTLFEENSWLKDFAQLVQDENYKGIKHKQWMLEPITNKFIQKTEIDKHPSPKLYLKWLEQNLNFNASNSLIEKIKTMDEELIDTTSDEFYKQLDWNDKKNRIKGI